MYQGEDDGDDEADHGDIEHGVIRVAVLCSQTHVPVTVVLVLGECSEVALTLTVYASRRPIPSTYDSFGSAENNQDKQLC